MGASLAEIRHVLSHPALSKGGLRVLDVGSQNLYRASEQEIVAFVRERNDVYEPADLARYARMLSLGSTMDPKIGGLNGAWLGDLLSRCDIDYAAYDIFHGYGTTLFDLNTMSLPASRRGWFDLVLNCGTTEHVLNQYNSFTVIHDAMRAGGLAYHALPMTGYLDHGYFNYNPRLFFELARANDYEVLELQFSGPGGTESIDEKFLSNADYAAALGAVDEVRERWAAHRLPVGSIVVLLRKTTDAAFRASIETSTTAGEVPEQIRDAYSRGSTVKPGRERSTQVEREQSALASLAAGAFRLKDAEALYADHARLMPDATYPLPLERFALVEYLRADPSRTDLRDRLATVERMLAAAVPLLSVNPDPARVDPAAVMLDGDERLLRERDPEDAQWFDTVVEAFRRYHAAGKVGAFPPVLEFEALVRLLERGGGDDDAIKIRVGKLLSTLTVAATLRRR
jgi:hypothetical protein